MLASVKGARRAFDKLKWRTGDDPRIAFAICGLDKTTGDNTIFLAMERGATAPLHKHLPRGGGQPPWPFRESITCLAGRLCGTDPHDPDFILEAGQSIDLTDDVPHQPYVPLDGFALVLYRQPGGHEILPEPKTTEDDEET